MTIVIALAGPAGSGKSAVADYLAQRYKAARYSLAAPLKEMVRSAFDLTLGQVYGSQAEKEAKDPRYGVSPRWLLQRIGTEGCRATFGDDFWTRICFERIEREHPRLAVIEDLRFVDEAEHLRAWRGFGGYVWRLVPPPDDETRTRAAAAGVHASEQEWARLPADLEIAPSCRGLELLESLVDEALGALLRPRQLDLPGTVGY